MGRKSVRFRSKPHPVAPSGAWVAILFGLFVLSSLFR